MANNGIIKIFDLRIGNDFYEKTAEPDIVYKWSKSEIRLDLLREEKDVLVALLNDQPTSEELIEIGKSQHPYYASENIQDRLSRIDQLLGIERYGP